MIESDYYDMKHRRSGDAYRLCWYSFIGMVLFLLASLLFSGCKSVQYVPVETVRTEYMHDTDTVIIKDTIQNEKETIIREATPSDSLLLAKVGLQLDESKRVILLLQKELSAQSHSEIERSRDTVRVVEREQVPYPVEKPLSKWQQFKVDWCGYILAAFFIVILIYLCYRLFKNHSLRR